MTEDERRLVVLDTNTLLQIVPRSSAYHFVWKAFEALRYRVCVFTEILNEYEEVIARKTSLAYADAVLNYILYSPCTVRIDAHYHWHLIKNDPDDNKFVDCAVAASAEYIVTDDAHFRILETIPFPHVRTVRLDEFAKAW